jgi:hypothetical protein
MLHWSCMQLMLPITTGRLSESAHIHIPFFQAWPGQGSQRPCSTFWSRFPQPRALLCACTTTPRLHTIAFLDLYDDNVFHVHVRARITTHRFSHWFAAVRSWIQARLHVSHACAPPWFDVAIYCKRWRPLSNACCSSACRHVCGTSEYLH